MPQPYLQISSEATQVKLQKKMGQVAEKELEIEAIRAAKRFGYPHINLAKFPISQSALRLMTEEQVEALQAVCFYVTPQEFRLGALDPTQPDVQDLLATLEDKTQVKGELYTISPNSLRRVLILYGTLPTIKPITKDIEIHEKDIERIKADVNDFQTLQELLHRKSTTDTLTILIAAGLRLEASDIHIEAEEHRVVVRLRLDGILHEAAELPKEIFSRLISRIKLTSQLKINITDQPQDGRFSINTTNGTIDVRVSTIPTIYGESVVLRLLRSSRQGLKFDDLGLWGSAYERLKQEIGRPNGMIITTGPTGSGKTTTMYAILQILNRPGVKIITLEDPVEYRLEGMNQSQIDHSKDYTFAKGLRSLLRQDPDIVMVGEIRDSETAEIAVQAALTGHLMLSTIHTNSAAAAIPRFLSMGNKPFLLAPALNCVIGQRLVRRLCASCKKPASLSQELEKRVKTIIAVIPQAELDTVQSKENIFYQSVGCAECHGLGYKGQIGVYEIFHITDTMKQIILGGSVSETEFEQIAIADGMVTMVQDGIVKALSGVTSLDEVFRVTE